MKLVAFGATWSYLDNGSQPAAEWTDQSFNDNNWQQGRAQFGYGDSDVETIVSFGPDPGDKHITTYFRHRFYVADPELFLATELALIRDDGAIVFLNGTEIVRDNLPSGSVSSQTTAITVIKGTAESEPVVASIDPSLLLAGYNWLAVEIHQHRPSSSDLSFDLEFTGFDELTPRLTRGPYLQLQDEDSITVRWRTDLPTTSRLRFGTSPETLDRLVESLTPTTEHRVAVRDLPAATRFFYAVGSATGDLTQTDELWFETAPTSGARVPVRFWALGDAGTGRPSAYRVRDAFIQYTSNQPSDFILLLGDNAYNDGTDVEYQLKFFNVFDPLLQTMTAWPTYGNHDAISADADSQTGPYFDIFDMPTDAEVGGVPSGTEAYYSFDFANAHFVVLDSMTSSSEPGSDMLTWLEEDLSANQADWTIAAFHHPPYSKGNHDSDLKEPLIKVRERFLPILERHGVDLVLSGHSHSYERSQLLDQHYGDSTSLLQSMILDAGDGRPDGDGVYEKESGGPASHEGAVYIVAGSAGKLDEDLELDHPVMEISLPHMGSLIVDIDGHELNATFLSDQGLILDYFGIEKAGVLHSDDFELSGLDRWLP